MAKTVDKKENSGEALKKIFETSKAPKPEQLEPMVQSWGQKRKPKKK